jgi:hypothetical protein
MVVAVIEVSCGEYGDNIRKLVSAIQNGKHDIRTGMPFPELPPAEALNNASVKLNGNGILAGNDTTNTGEGDSIKFIDGATNVNIYQPYATKDLAKDEPSKYLKIKKNGKLLPKK